MFNGTHSPVRALILSATVLVMAVSCFACYAPAVRRTLPPSSEAAYIFGVFMIQGEHNLNDIGIIFENVESGKEYIMRMYEGHGGVYAIQVPPGRYRLLPVIRFDFEASFPTRQPSDLLAGHGRSGAEFPIEQGQALYVGRFEGRQARFGTLMTLRLESCKNDFVADSLRFLLEYPHFNGFPLKPAYAPGAEL